MATKRSSKTTSNASSIVTDNPDPYHLTSLQTFFVITSSITAEICCGAIFILNFYIAYFVSYVRIRGSKQDITIEDGKLMLLLVAASYGMSGFPLGVIISGMEVVLSLTIGAGVFVLGYGMIFLGAQFDYGFVIAGAVCLGSSAMMINISILLRCLRNFKEHWGIVSGSLFGVSFGSTAIFHIWERAIVNPLNISPVELESTDAMFWFFHSQAVLDRCAEFYFIMAGCLAVLLIYPLIVYRLIPPPPPLPEEMIPFLDACRKTLSKILSDVRFILALVAFEFGCVAGLCARSSLKTYGESFIKDEHYLSSVGSSGSFAGAVGAFSMGIIMDITRTGTPSGTSPKLLLFNCLLAFTASVMMMFAHKEGRIWYLFCYDTILFGFGGFSALTALVLYEIFGISKFPIAYGIASLSTFLSTLWYTFSMFSGIPGKDFWLANALFAFMAVVSSIALIIQYQTSPVAPGDGSSLSDEEEEDSDYIYHDGKKYVLQQSWS